MREEILKRKIERDGHWVVPTTAGRYALFVKYKGRYVCWHRLVAAFLMNRPDALKYNVKVTRLCGNRYCINPEHLKVWSMSEAIRHWREAPKPFKSRTAKPFRNKR